MEKKILENENHRFSKENEEMKNKIKEMNKKIKDLENKIHKGEKFFFTDIDKDKNNNKIETEFKE